LRQGENCLRSFRVGIEKFEHIESSRCENCTEHVMFDSLGIIYIFRRQKFVEGRFPSQYHL